MTQSENTNTTEQHGCIVCGRTFNMLAVYAPNHKLVDCTVTSAGGHRVPDQQHPLAACDTHSAGEIAAAYKRWLSRNDPGLDPEQEDE